MVNKWLPTSSARGRHCVTPHFWGGDTQGALNVDLFPGAAVMICAPPGPTQVGFDPLTRRLSDIETRVLEAFLDAILSGYRAGSLTQSEARQEIAEAVSLAVNDNGNLSTYMRAEIETRGKAVRSKRPVASNASNAPAN
jgi:hypothetical protein